MLAEEKKVALADNESSIIMLKTEYNNLHSVIRQLAG